MKSFAILGLGRFGSVLATELVRSGYEVVAIDNQRAMVEAIADVVPHAVILDATDEKALASQGVARVDCAVVAIGESFEANILATINCKSFDVPWVVARGMTRSQCKILERLGADQVIQPEEASARRLWHQLVSPKLLSYEELVEGVGVSQLEAPAMFHDRSLIDIDLRRHFNVNLVAIRRARSSGKGRDHVIFPAGDTFIRPGDLLVLVGADPHLAALADCQAEG